MARVARKVIVQPADPMLDKKNILSRQKKIRVAYYARVSTNNEEQETSFQTQKEYYEEKIRNHDNWVLVNGYADKGISGTNTNKREQFKQMIEDCKAGKIDLILTKSISRFARNTLDTLKIVRDLQRINVSVLFEKENINTATQDCEMLLTIFSSAAQEESRNLSENVKWALKAKFERGEIMMCTNRFLGLDRDENGDLVINEEQAKVVRLIAMLYLSGLSWEDIARELDRRGIKTVTGKDHWNASTIGSILRNEKYAGYAIQGKSYTVDFLTKRRVKNKGERPKYKTLDGIPAILPVSVYMRIQEEMASRAIALRPNIDGEHSGKVRHGKYVLTELLRCNNCGSHYRRAIWTLGGKKIPVYRCKNRLLKGTVCENSPTLKESDLERVILLTINEMKKQNCDQAVNNIVLNNIRQVIEKRSEYNSDNIDKEIRKVKEEMNALIYQGMNGFEEDPEVDQKLIEKVGELKQLQFARKELLNGKNGNQRMHEIENYVDNTITNIKQFDNALIRKMIDRINVFEDASIEIHFKFGAVVRKEIGHART